MTVLLLVIRIILLTKLICSILGINLVLTFRTPRELGCLFESIGSPMGLIVTVPKLGPCRPSILVILATAFLAFILVISTLIRLLALV